MADFKMDGTTALSKSGGTISVASGVTFPAGHIVYIAHDETDAYGNVGDHTSWYPNTASELDTKTLYLNITASQHAPFSKLKIDYTMDIEARVANHTIADYRLVRYQQTDAPTGDTGTSVRNIIAGSTGSASTYADTQSMGCVSGSAIDDISSLTGDIKYVIQTRNGSGSGVFAANIYHGRDSAFCKFQMVVCGIV
tara:strand:+ start:615 stop:1202 length:588 start_codon:yes stop_codon:yes gene_type:complete